jgi:hypothetical protein
MSSWPGEILVGSDLRHNTRGESNLNGLLTWGNER